jgi:hypothetical protein
MQMLSTDTKPLERYDPSPDTSPFAELLTCIAVTVGYMMGAKDYWPHGDTPFPRAH